MNPRFRPRLAALVLCVCGLARVGSAQPAPQVDVGLGKGITIRSADDQASMNIRARIQVRATALSGLGEEQADVTEIAIRRMRLVFQGNALGPTLTYYVQLSFSNLDNEADLRLPLRDAYVTWQPSSRLGVRFGQMKVPFSRQRVVSSSALEMVDRSIVVSELNLDRDVGLQVFSRNVGGNGKVGFSAGLFSGEGRNRLGREAGFLYTARVEAWPLGAFDDLVEGDLKREPRWRVAIGANVGYNQNTNRPRSTIGTPFPAGSFDYTHAAADVVVKKSGWSVTAEAMYRSAEADARIVVAAPSSENRIMSRSAWGAFVQAGRMMTPRLDVVARYSRLVPHRGTDPTLLRASEIGGGAGYYIAGHDLKVQGDVFRVTDTTSGRHILQVRTQFQLFF